MAGGGDFSFRPDCAETAVAKNKSNSEIIVNCFILPVASLLTLVRINDECRFDATNGKNVPFAIFEIN